MIFNMISLVILVILAAGALAPALDWLSDRMTSNDLDDMP